MAEIAHLDLEWFFGVNTPQFRDADLHAIILSIGLFAVVYTTLGGIRAVVWTDVIQFLILMGGALFTIAYIATTTHSGLGDWLAVSRTYQHRESVEWFSWDMGNRSTVFSIAVGMSFWFICTHGANQVALQRYFSVKGMWAARRSYLISAVASFALGVILAGVGLSLAYFIQHHELPAGTGIQAADKAIRYEAQDKVFPQFIRFYLPGGLRGLVVAALFAAAMSTIDSGANSVSTILTVDFFRRLRWPRSDPSGQQPDSELRLARTVTATMGLVIVACTIFLYHLSKGTDIISLCQKGFNCFLGPLGALFVLGMFSSRATGRTVIPAVLLGEVFGICASYSEELFGVRYSTHLVVPGSWLATVAAAHVFNVLLGSRAGEEERKWMWRPVVRGRELPGASGGAV
jgi:SSS family solute:Na+ symporter